ncbi:YaiI/YqxD family protein [Paenibacillus curdlanolyticus]|nr:YaiI/YqxD family protein [Paenibacillus curdlanolyticus]
MPVTGFTILVDGDACPVKREITTTAAQFHVPVLMVSSYDHRLEAAEGVQVLQVDRGADSVDLHIVNRTKSGDIVVTQDLGLGSLALAKGAIVLSPRGEQIVEDEIGHLLERRHESARRRRAGGKTKGPRALTEDDRRRFQQKLTKLLMERQEFSQF